MDEYANRRSWTRWLFPGYVAFFAVTATAMFLQPSLVRPSAAMLGLLGAAIGGCLALDIDGFARSSASRTRKYTEKHPALYPPILSSVTYARVFGVLCFLVGIGFSVQAITVDDF